MAGQSSSGGGQTGRPILIQLFCGVGFLTILFVVMLLIPSVRQQLTQQFGGGTVLVFALGALGTFFAAIGCWHMRKWGVYLYGGVVVLNVLSSMASNGLMAGVVAGAIPVLILAVLWSNLEKMS